MSCPICNRNNCCPSFHSIEAQEDYEKDHEYCIEKIERLESKIEELEAALEGWENGSP
jgi:exonuclease VII small subunit